MIHAGGLLLDLAVHAVLYKLQCISTQGQHSGNMINFEMHAA
jgi:hypothetical protein